jgi:uncharacterized membrane protein
MQAKAVGKEILMNAFSAVTINCSEEEIVARLPEAESPLSDDAAQVSLAQAPGNRGTEVRVALDKSGVGGAIGQKVSAAFGTDQQRQLDDALRRFKQLLEAGEVIRSEGSPEGTDAKQQRQQRPAEPVVPTSTN